MWDYYISIIGYSDDFAIEIASGSWFESLLFPRVTGFLVVGPLGAVGGTAVGIIMAYQFERKLWKKVSEAIQKRKSKSVNYRKYRSLWQVVVVVLVDKMKAS